MSLLTLERVTQLLAPAEPPCVSLYQPTHRRHPENQQDPIRFKNLIRVVEESLRQKHPTRDVRGIMEPFQKLAGDAAFWNHTRDGLAIFAGAGRFDVFQLQRPLPELAVVADSFHVKPLLRYVQSADRFHVLALSRDRAVVHEGDRDHLDVETLPDDFPAKADVKNDLDAEKFYRALDQAVAATFSKPTGQPLVLAGLTENQALYRKLAKDPLLLPEGFRGDPQPLSADELRAKVWPALEPHYLARLAAFKQDFSTAVARQAGSGDLSDVARAAVAGRVGTLLLEAERVIPGVIDRATGAIKAEALSSPKVDDMLDDLAEIVLGKGGQVAVVPKDKMPTASGLAAIYRF